MMCGPILTREPPPSRIGAARAPLGSQVTGHNMRRSPINEPTEGPLALSPLSWAYADAWTPEPGPVSAARARGAALGAAPVSKGTAGLLRVLAAARGVENAVEIGTGSGVTSAAIVAGMAASGVLTSIDLEAGFQGIARDMFAELEVPHTRVRLIAGRPEDVLPRLSDEAYDLMYISTQYASAELLEQARRLLRESGLLVIGGALEGNQSLADSVREDSEFLPTMIPVGDGVLVAVRRREQR